MLDLIVSRKNKISLEEYDYKADIENRIMMSSFTLQDVEVLEEILYGSIQIPLVKMKKNLDLSDKELSSVLQKLVKTKLFRIVDDSIIVDKEMRKYYDYQMLKFDEDFKPDMSYIQGLLKKVPIQNLPTWYAVPRSSNNIFASLIERYFTTPQVYERYLLDLNLTEPVMSGIISELFEQKDYQLSKESVCKKYDLTDEVFQEYMLHLEFNFVWCTSFVLKDDKYREVITPFYEWKEHLLGKQRNTPSSIAKEEEKCSLSKYKFNFVRDMTFLLEEVIHHPLSLQSSATESDFIFPEEVVKQLMSSMGLDSKEDVLTWQLYFSRLSSRLVRIGLAIRHEEMLCPHHHAPHWLNMEDEDKALYLYRHPENKTLKMGFNQDLDTEKNVKDVEKSLERIDTTGWIDIDVFLSGMSCPIGDNSPIELTKIGPNWMYKMPTYNDEELQFMRYVVMQRLYEIGMVEVGLYKGKDCFKLLTFGKETLC